MNITDVIKSIAETEKIKDVIKIKEDFIRDLTGREFRLIDVIARDKNGNKKILDYCNGEPVFCLKRIKVEPTYKYELEKDIATEGVKVKYPTVNGTKDIVIRRDILSYLINKKGLFNKGYSEYTVDELCKVCNLKMNNEYERTNSMTNIRREINNCVKLGLFSKYKAVTTILMLPKSANETDGAHYKRCRTTKGGINQETTWRLAITEELYNKCERIGYNWNMKKFNSNELKDINEKALEWVKENTKRIKYKVELIKEETYPELETENSNEVLINDDIEEVQAIEEEVVEEESAVEEESVEEEVEVVVEEESVEEEVQAVVEEESVEEEVEAVVEEESVEEEVVNQKSIITNDCIEVKDMSLLSDWLEEKYTRYAEENNIKLRSYCDICNEIATGDGYTFIGIFECLLNNNQVLNYNTVRNLFKTALVEFISDTNEETEESVEEENVSIENVLQISSDDLNKISCEVKEQAKLNWLSEERYGVYFDAALEEILNGIKDPENITNNFGYVKIVFKHLKRNLDNRSWDRTHSVEEVKEEVQVVVEEESVEEVVEVVVEEESVKEEVEVVVEEESVKEEVIEEVKPAVIEESVEEEVKKEKKYTLVEVKLPYEIEQESYKELPNDLTTLDIEDLFEVVLQIPYEDAKNIYEKTKEQTGLNWMDEDPYDEYFEPALRAIVGGEMHPGNVSNNRYVQQIFSTLKFKIDNYDYDSRQRELYSKTKERFDDISFM